MMPGLPWKVPRIPAGANGRLVYPHREGILLDGFARRLERADSGHGGPTPWQGSRVAFIVTRQLGKKKRKTRAGNRALRAE